MKRTFSNGGAADNWRYTAVLLPRGGAVSYVLMLSLSPWVLPVIVDFSMEDAYGINHYQVGGLSR